MVDLLFTTAVKNDLPSETEEPVSK